jgi:two-component system, sensor histidine kinase and response regulator
VVKSSVVNKRAGTAHNGLYGLEERIVRDYGCVRSKFLAMDDMSAVWILVAMNVLLVVPLILLLIHSSRRARAGRRHAETERIRFHDNERRLRSILEAEPQGIMVLGLDCRVLQINPAGCVLFDAGFPEEIIGKDLRDHIHPNDRSTIEDMQRAARDGRESCAKGRLTGLSGYVRWIDITSVPLPEDDGTVQSVLSVVRDVTEQKRADRRQILQHTVAKALASTSTMEQAVPDLLQAIATSLDWHVGVFWCVQDDRHAVACGQDWSVDPAAMQEFLRVSRQRVYTSGCDLPGRCWARGDQCGWKMSRQIPSLREGLPGRCAQRARFPFG